MSCQIEIKQLDTCKAKVKHNNQVAISKYFVIQANSTVLSGLPASKISSLVNVTSKTLDTKSITQKFINAQQRKSEVPKLTNDRDSNTNLHIDKNSNLI